MPRDPDLASGTSENLSTFSYLGPLGRIAWNLRQCPCPAVTGGFQCVNCVSPSYARLELYWTATHCFRRQTKVAERVASA